MPMFENCPEEAERYRRAYVEYWKDAVSYTYEAMVKSICAITDARKIVPILEGLKDLRD